MYVRDHRGEMHLRAEVKLARRQQVTQRLQLCNITEMRHVPEHAEQEKRRITNLFVRMCKCKDTQQTLQLQTTYLQTFVCVHLTDFFSTTVSTMAKVLLVRLVVAFGYFFFLMSFPSTNGNC